AQLSPPHRPCPATLLPASRQPPEAQLLPHAGPLGPAHASWWPLRAQIPPNPTALPAQNSLPQRGPLWAQPLLRPADDLCGPKTSRSRPRQAQLLPGVSPEWRGLCPALAPAGPDLAWAWPPEAQLLPIGLSRPAYWPSASSPGPELFPVGLSRPWLSLPAASTGPTPASRQARSAQLLPSSCPAPGSLCRPQASLRKAFQARLQLPGGTERPGSCLTAASPGPAVASSGPPQATSPPASRQPRQTQLPPAEDLLKRLISCLAVASPGPALLPRGSLRGPGSCIPMAS
ncbi:putative uncharacterized protein FLJ44672, partial [Hylobates moloch]|uniref:putative uncharacterized protein FLJ44672 n=1 Tax=Hylobates moloch TaxID=81572 RepID=UPI00267550FF